jgi:magnesium-protoporphyrin O-methyltransferase
MTTCCAPLPSSSTSPFDHAHAVREMNAYRRNGAGVTTRRLVAALTTCNLVEGTLLDVGAGCGALTFELLRRGMTEAICVDPAAAYREVAFEEAVRLGLERRVRNWLVATLRDVTTRLRPADVVTLDRVVCCDADPSALVATAADLSRRAVALSYPRDVRWVRLATAVANWWRCLRGVQPTFVHPERTLVGPLHDAGFRLATQTDAAFWRIAVYERT